MIRKSMPSDLIRGWVPVFPRDKREAFARRSCSNKKIERDDDSKKSHPALGDLKMPAIMSLEEPRPRGTVLGERADRLRVSEAENFFRCNILRRLSRRAGLRVGFGSY